MKRAIPQVNSLRNSFTDIVCGMRLLTCSGMKIVAVASRAELAVRRL
jgi:hypothetical protein